MAGASCAGVGSKCFRECLSDRAQQGDDNAPYFAPLQEHKNEIF